MRVLPSLPLLIALFAAPLLAQTPTPAPAAPATAPATPAASTGSWVGEQARRPLDRIPPEQRLTLTTDGGEQFPARYLPDLTGQPRGGVLLLHDAGQHPTWPFTLAALFEELPLHGWSTLAIELPTPAAPNSPEAALAPAAVDPAAAAATPPAGSATPPTPPAQTPPPAPVTADPNAATTPAPASTTPTLSAREMAVQARIDAGIQLLAPNPTADGVVVLIGFGSGAIRAAEAIRLRAAASQSSTAGAAGTPKPLKALLLVDAENELPGMATTLPQLLPLSSLPTLDLVQGEDQPQLLAQEQRRRAVLRQRERLYRAVVLPPLSAANGSDRSAMSKRIRGFLQQLPQPAGDPAAKSTPPAAVPALP